MERSVFISYSSDDKAIADQVCHLLESNGLHCWIAPRDVPAGGQFAEEIIRAIEACPAFLLILSLASNASKFVHSEVERAFTKDKVLFILRIQDIQPVRRLELFISSSQWVDAFPSPVEPIIHGLAIGIASMLPKQEVVAAAPPLPHKSRGPEC